MPREKQEGARLSELLAGVNCLLLGQSWLNITPSDTVILLLVDGLGHLQLQEYGDLVPNLVNFNQGPLLSSSPTVTPTNLASLATGLNTGEHGIFGTQFYMDNRRANALKAQYLNENNAKLSAKELNSTENLFKHPIAKFKTYQVKEKKFFNTVYNQAFFGCNNLVELQNLQELPAVIEQLQEQNGKKFIYAYWHGLDEVAHSLGVGSLEYRERLVMLNLIVGQLRSILGAGAKLLITADHGMVNIDFQDVIDVNKIPELRRGVRWVSGNARFRHIYAKGERGSEVVDGWKNFFRGDRLVLSRKEAIESGLFGPSVLSGFYSRIGDAVVIDQRKGVILENAKGLFRQPKGDHAALTDEERLVPLIVLE